MAETMVSLESGETNNTLLDESKKKMDPKMDLKASATTCRNCSWFLVITTVVLSLAFQVTTICWHVARHWHLTPREQRICVPCTELTNATGDTVTAITRRYYDDGGKIQICCADASVILSNMVEKYTEIKYNQEASPAYSKCDTGREKAAARLTGVMVANMQQGGQEIVQTDVLQWNRSSHMSFIKTGVSYSNGYMTVIGDGYYYIFSQVKYTDVITDPGHGTNSNYEAALDYNSDSNMKHSLYHYSSSHGTDNKLIVSSRSQCQIYSKHGNCTNFMGAVFKLGAGDKVFVKTSHPHMITTL